MHVEDKIYFLSSPCPVTTSGLLGQHLLRNSHLHSSVTNSHTELLFPMSLQICELSRFVFADSPLLQKLYSPQVTLFVLTVL